LPKDCKELVLHDYKYLWDIDIIPFKKVLTRMGRIGKCNCGGEMQVYEKFADTAISYICPKCGKVLQATDYL
jgi:hypothetical protein